MNSLNIISARVSPTSSPVSSRSNSLSAISLAAPAESTNEQGSQDDAVESALENPNPSPADSQPEPPTAEDKLEARIHGVPLRPVNEETPLLATIDEKSAHIRSPPSWHLIPRRIAATLLSSIRLVLSALAAPGVYLWACFCDENGNFAPLLQLRKLFGLHNKAKIPKFAIDACDSTDEDHSSSSASASSGLKAGRRPASGASSSGLSSESESDRSSSQKRDGSSRASGRRHSRSKSLQGTEEIAPSKRSIRIKLHEDGSLRQRKHRKTASASVAGTSRPAKAGAASGADRAGLSPPDVAAQLKSPTSPIGALTKYPKTPAPPRPLIPRRQPSYINFERPLREGPKTLILDLDETLIHSMSKGGRMGSGHMVEVRLNTNMVGLGPQQNMSTQHPILYYVHKRPHCDEFLKKVQKWYNLVVFTASVQEYADPVIDFLEAERKFFTKRYYRQHCTFRHGAFIKDLSSVEPDLSKVMILDNSPLSYMFHQDNAIPIQGWINDPTDNDLLHLIPFLEGLQYVSDVRALLALRNGEDGEHLAA